MKGKGKASKWTTRNGIHVPSFDDYTVRGEVKSKPNRFRLKLGNNRLPEETEKQRTDDIKQAFGNPDGVNMERDDNRTLMGLDSKNLPDDQRRVVDENAAKNKWQPTPEDKALVKEDNLKAGYEVTSSNAIINNSKSITSTKKDMISQAGSRYKTQDNQTETNYGDDYIAQNISVMSVSALKIAYMNAPVELKAKIKEELKNRGYVFENGKWIKE